MASRFGHLHLRTALSQLKSNVFVLGRGPSPFLMRYFKSGTQSYSLFGVRQLHSSLALEATHVVNMPSLSPTMTEGTIVKWMKKEGDPISAGDVLCEIQTDKAVVSLESEEDGILAKILMPENSADVKVGTLIALTVDEGDDWKAAVAPDGSSASASTASAPSSEPSSAAAEVAPAQGVHLVNMPSLSPTMTEGTIVQWMKKEGDPISAGDILCEIQTDKAVVSLEWDEDAILAKILVKEGEHDVKVGSLIALTVDEGIDWKDVQIPTVSKAAPAKASAPTSAPAKSESASSSQAVPTKVERLIGPAVKNYLRKYGIAASQVNGTGPHGVISKGDVLKHVLSNKISAVPQVGGTVGGAAKSSAAQTAGKGAPSKSGAAPKEKKGSPASFVDLEITNMRRVIAKRLLQSKSTISHAYGTAECDTKNIAALRKKLAGEGIKISVNDIIIKCAGNALSKVPAVNCVWEGEKLSQKAVADISVAVSTPNGLITPIVFNVGDKDVIRVGDSVKMLAGKARDGKLQPHEFVGGTFTISNLGMFGIHAFSAIINPPQCAILAVGGNSVTIDEIGKPLSTVKLTLSYDASAIEEVQASKYMAILKNEIENASEISMGIYDLLARKEMIDSESVASNSK